MLPLDSGSMVHLGRESERLGNSQCAWHTTASSAADHRWLERYAKKAWLVEGLGRARYSVVGPLLRPSNRVAPVHGRVGRAWGRAEHLLQQRVERWRGVDHPRQAGDLGEHLGVPMAGHHSQLES